MARNAIVLPDFKGYGLDKRESSYRGSKYFSERYFNLAILSKKKSGKTTLIYNILRKTVQKNTIVIFYVSTFWKDKTYEFMRRWLDKKKITYDGHTHFVEDGTNHLEEFLDQNKTADDTPTQPVPEPAEVTLEDILFDTQPVPEPSSKKKKRVKPPEYIIIFDDLSRDLRHSSVEKLLKKNRHYKAKVILSSQNITDLAPASFQQLDYCLIFKSFNEETLYKLYERLDLWNEYEDFLKQYKNAIEKDYGFLFIDLVEQELRTGLRRL